MESDETGERPQDGKATSLSATQELKSPTVADVLEVFGHFRDDLLAQIDKRDESVLRLVQKTASDTLAEYARLAEQGRDHSVQLEKHEAAIKDLERKHNEIASELSALKLKVERGLRK